MAPPSSTRPIILALALLAAAAPARSTSPDAPSSFALDSQQAPSKTTSLSRFGETVEQAAPLDAAASAVTGDVENEMEKSAEPSGDGEHKIRARNAAPVRFWSGPRYGRSGRSGSRGSSETQAHGGGGNSGKSSVGMAMSLRSSGPAIQPRHDRFFLGSRYGKRNQGEVWRGGEEDEEEDEEEREERRRREEEAARVLKEALRLKGLTGDPEDVFGVTSQRVSSSVPQPASCIYTGFGNLYRCYEGRRDDGGVH